MQHPLALQIGAAALLAWLGGCESGAVAASSRAGGATASGRFEPPPERTSEVMPGGATSISQPAGAPPAFDLPAANLRPDQRTAFYAGRALARQPWVKAPSSTDARDGLGPLYNARSCLACHVRGGRGRVSTADGQLSTATLVRLSLPGRDPSVGVLPEPTYGTQLQLRSIALREQLPGSGGRSGVRLSSIPAEAGVAVRWLEQAYRYPDGSEVVLRRPEIALEGLGYGPLHAETRIGLRHTPPLHGLGLLALIDQEDIARLADPDDRDGDGVSGRQNRVWDPIDGRARPGRFGLKANQASLRVQVAAALRTDVGITSSVFPEQPCTAAQPRCQRAPGGALAGEAEISDDLLALLVGFVRSIGVPRRRTADHPLVRRGRGLFYRTGCASCHAPSFVTGSDPSAPHLSGQEIWPYTDLLLHDMGPGLSDGRRDYLAAGSEWRTPPLWGVGLARAVRKDVGLLHDGRARTVEEAVLWHDGEARASRERYAGLAARDRRALLSFVRSL
ncbi:MAG: thiol oxidoreductase [Myxococcales bacterium]|nr:thiol oxidoreductase [Myxococcales bacterium]MDD9970550.1 thiol oxidoreductase [Myxococcales bacterium]